MEKLVDKVEDKVEDKVVDKVIDKVMDMAMGKVVEKVMDKSLNMVVDKVVDMMVDNVVDRVENILCAHLHKTLRTKTVHAPQVCTRPDLQVLNKFHDSLNEITQTRVYKQYLQHGQYSYFPWRYLHYFIQKIIIPLNECHIFGSGTTLSPESLQKLQTALP